MVPRTPFSAGLICLIGQLGNGGTERQLYLFLKHLDRTRLRPLVVVSGEASGIWRERLEQELGVPVVFLGGGSAPLKLWRCWRLVRQTRPRAIISWSFFTNAFRMVSGDVWFVGSLRQQLAVERRQLPWWRVRMSLNGPALIVNSTQVAAEIRDAGVDEARIHLVHNIFEPANAVADRAELRRELGLSAEAVVVAGVGRNSPTKDWPFFLATFAMAHAACPNLHGLLIGSGGTALLPAIQQAGLTDAITVIGEVPEARRLLPAADIFFLSSREEGLPNVLLEAIDAGCAILATEVGGVRDILGEGRRDAGAGARAPGDENLTSEAPAGIIVEPGNITMATEKLVLLAGDEALRRTLVANARARLGQFSPAAAMAKYLEVLRLN